MPKPTCVEDGCSAQAARRKRCGPHFTAWAREHMPQCAEDGCEEGGYTGGRCRPHYTALMKTQRSPRGECLLDGCTDEIVSLGLCGTHYSRQWRKGDPQPDKPRQQLRRKFNRTWERTAGGVSRLLITNIRTGTTDTVLYDDVDHDLLAQYEWYVSTSPNYVSATPRGQRREISMHRVIMGCSTGDGLVVDHRNGVITDNRRSNLRVVTNQRNVDHQAIVNGRGTSRFRNVHWNSAKRKWLVEFSINKKAIFPPGGAFDDEIEAARFAWRYRLEHGMEPGYWPVKQ